MSTVEPTVIIDLDDVFVLYRLEKMKQREIAALYGISVSSVEKYVARATEHLSLVFGPL